MPREFGPLPQDLGLDKPPATIETAAVPESIEKPANQFHSPYYEVTLAAFDKEVPERKEELTVVLDEIDRQGIANFASYKSEAMPGVAFSFTKLSVTPELISKLNKSEPGSEPSAKEPVVDDESGEEDVKAKRQDYFLFTAFASPPDGHAFTVQDVAIDRFIRLLPRVARPMKQGQEPPEVNVYLMGAPTGFGGSVTPEWVDGVNKNGMETHAALYSEFIKQQEQPTEAGEQKDVHIVLQGVSKGAVIAEKTSKYLPLDLQKNTQRLLDNPAGDHKPGQFIKGAQVVAGMGFETVSRMLFDNTIMKPLMKKGAEFVNNLSAASGIGKDNKEQAKLKRQAALAEGLALVKGSPMDTESTRSFIRRGIYDPLTFTPKRLLDIWQKQQAGEKIPTFSKGKSRETPFKGRHFFVYNRYKRWGKILGYIEGSKKPA